MKPTRSVVLAFFPDAAGSSRALRELRRNGIHRAATIQRSQTGHISVTGNRVWGRRGAVASSAVALALLSGYGLTLIPPSRNDVARWAAIALLIISGIAAGWFLLRALTVGVDRRLLASYQHWVLPGESLILVHMASQQARSIVDVLRHADHEQPAVFVIRPPYDRSLPRSEALRRDRLATEQLKRHAAELAVSHQIAARSTRAHPVMERVRASDRMIDAISADLAEAVDRDQSVSLAAEWLLDNAYIVQRHIGDVQRNLSRRLYDVLPVLGGPPYADEPRVYALAAEFIAVTDAEVYEADIVAFLRAYQETTPLTFAELWAMPLMLRVALIETLSGRARDIDQRQHEHERADLWANRLLTAARRDPDYLLFALAQLAREQPVPSPYVVDRLVSQLQGEVLALEPLRTWLEHKLAASLSEVIQREQREHAADQVTLANAIGSLRQLSSLDWRDVFEQVSVVDQVLRTDPAGIYAKMDFGTRDRYRHAVEEIARGSTASEITVAQFAIEAARRACAPDRRAHIGYFLISAGRHELEARTQYHPPFRLRLRRWVRRNSTSVWLGSVGTLTLGILAGLLALADVTSAADARLVAFIVIAALAVLPASDVAVQVAGFLVTRLLPPTVLPKMAFDDGIPDEWRTLVVVPNLLLSSNSVQEELEQLEIRFLANQDRNLHFALLADFPDAPEQEMPGDQVVLAAAVHGTEQLNARYEGLPFSLFYRRRCWSESEQVWMGWERKRGKLEELNRLLVSDSVAEFGKHDDPNHAGLQHVGDSTQLRGVRFVITLDVDTQLTRGTARRMVATLAHPLNRPRDGTSGITINEGYTIIQPRVSTSLPSATATRFSRAFTDPFGTDPYTQAVSDVYQDLTGEGSYHGKGIYDVQMFHQVLSGRFPNAALLSHDLLEGAHVRVGLATDIELFDFFPSTYLAYSTRQQRWIRGDWQIADWCTPRVPTAAGMRVPNLLSVMNRWKILDNLRRSLVPAASVALLIAGWLLLPELAALWSGLIGLMLVVPATLQLTSWLAMQPIGAIAVWQRWRYWRELGPAWARAVLSAALLPHEAAIALDAIVRVAFRRRISHRLLLEWQTAQAAHRSPAERERGLMIRMAAISLGSVGLLGAIVWLRSDAVWPALPFLALWTASPGIVAWLDARVERRPMRELSADDRLLLRKLARQTWRYFDAFVGPQSHWLPPDNYQDALRVEVAQRTSPTNIGLWLLSGLAAADGGYVTLEDLIERSAGTLETLDTLEHFEGHLLNWYDIGTLAPLYPRYVSTVDSGNLLASLWTAAQGYQELLNRPLIGPYVLAGLADTLALLQEALASELSTGAASERMRHVASRLAAVCVDPPHDLCGVIQRLRDASGPAHELALEGQRRPIVQSGRASHPGRSGQPAVPEHPAEIESVYWSLQIDQQVRHWIQVVDRYLPWVERLARLSDEALLALGADAPEWRRQILVAAPSAQALASDGYDPIAAFRESSSQTQAAPTRLGDWLADITSSVTCARQHAGVLVARADNLIAQCEDLADGMNLRFLYDVDRRLFTIGFNVEARRLDTSYYDMLASEARLASFVSVARDDVPVEHWLALGRTFGILGRRRVLLSWSGTMFEYLMPLLVTRTFDHSLLDDACHAALRSQIDYADRRGVPWGISEAAFSAVDTSHIYQYQAFGVPGLGMKRGLQDDVVVAPYASALALAIDPRAAVANLRRLAQIGLQGSYGFYDSIDYTRQRQTAGHAGIIAHTYMAHHQGMILLAIDNALHGNVMQRRFHADRRVRATEPLLFERIPVAPVLVDGRPRDGLARQLTSGTTTSPPSRTLTPDAPTPRTQLLGHGSYTVMITSAGGGYSRWRDIDLSRWRADTTADAWGTFCYVKDLDQGTVWSTAHQPTRRTASRYAVTFTTDRAEFERRDAGIGTLTEITVALEDDADLRRITLTNYSNRIRRLDVTSYTELALAPHNADLAHPAFSKLFVHTEALPEQHALLAWRKPRSREEHSVWAVHMLALPTAADDSMQAVQYETDRAQFVGRGRTLENPAALDSMLSNTTGAVLDPILSLRCRIRLEPGQRVQLVFVTGAADTRDGVLALVEKYRDLHAAQRAFELTRFQAQLEPRQLRISIDDIQRFQQLASHMLFPNARLRAAEQRLRQNRLGQSSLWAYGISGDLPILLATIGDVRDLELVREVLAAHTYWRLRGYMTDLVILNEEVGSYAQPLGEELKKLIQWHAQYTPVDQPSGMFLRSVDHITTDDLTLLLTTARAVLVAARGPLAQQLAAPAETVKVPPLLAVPRQPEEEPSAPLPFMELPYFNGLGGFTPDGKEYAIYLGPGMQTPAPWVNVFANPEFGALVSESGTGFNWCGNSQSNRLLPWSNDPISDPSGDAIYIRDEQTGLFWTPTPAPIREVDAYRTRHGQGFTVFEHNSHAIEQELVTFVPMDDSGGATLRVQLLRLRNRSSRRRRLSVTAYAEWVLGANREQTQMHVVTNWDSESRALFARNAYHPDVANRVAFASASPRASSYTADRTEFLGRNGSNDRPAAMLRESLSGRTGAGLDPCAALQVVVELDPGQDANVILLLGQAADTTQARDLLRRFRTADRVDDALQTTRAWWDRLLETIQVETPDLAINLMLNRWLLYQTLSCRVWGRSGFYQSGGAVGFRDQLQDAMALLYAAPELSRNQILTAAARQFVEGDVQHWWHPQSGAGVRTRISDDLLWLPYVITQYVRVTGDAQILDEVVPFLEGPPLAAHEHERFFVPAMSIEGGSVVDHCHRAIARGLTRGPHGLPLIGTGDWNDGMNLVGVDGRGESVWLAWFLIDVLQGFADLIEQHGQREPAGRYRDDARHLATAVEAHAWDGAWYRRAFFDDGTPLGSKDNHEDTIDSLAQSWGVISGAADPTRAELALQAVESFLIREQDRMILLFTPPFEHAALDPGYLKGYPPGVRENGGQYTHAAIWVALAFARLRKGDRATTLLRMLNPVEHARTPEEVQRYKVEPYVVAADVYALNGHVGRGGWTWYTGSSGWMYRVWLEDVLGFKLRGDRLTLDPVLQRDWQCVRIKFRYKSALYDIAIENPDAVNCGVFWIDLDHQRMSGQIITLHDDGETHSVIVRLGAVASE
jgi:cellobiose phosphorylase